MTHSSSPMPSRSGWRSALSSYMLATAVAALAFGAGVALTNADAVVSRGFATALAGGAGDAQGNASAPLVAGSEDYWLTRERKAHHPGGHVEPAAWSGLPTPFGVAVGDRITITSGGKERVLEVVSVEDVADEVTRIDAASPAQSHRIVTCRDASAGTGDLMQFVTGAPDNAQTARVKPVRAL